MGWHDVEVIADPLGKPGLILNGGTRQRADLLGVHHSLVTLAHTEAYAVANVILIGNEGRENEEMG